MTETEFYDSMDGLYRYYPREFEGLPLMFRQNLITGKIQIQVTDNFAKANGYDGGLDDLKRAICEYYHEETLMLPEWMTLDNGDSFARMN